MGRVLELSLDPLAGDLELERTREDEEELPRDRVVVPHLARARRHPLLDDAQGGRLHEVPAVAPRAPGVVRGVPLLDHRGLLTRARSHARFVQARRGRRGGRGEETPPGRDLLAAPRRPLDAYNRRRSGSEAVASRQA